MIKTDPSQTKTVVVLIVVLVAAVVFTVMRIHPGGQQQQAAAPGAAQAAEAAPSASVSIVPAFQPSRNPFHKPEDLQRASTDSSASRPGIGTVAVQESGGQRPGGMSIPPMPVAAVPSQGAGQMSEPSATDAKSKEAARPQFALTAVVGGPDGFTAVIRCGESNSRVVGVGDLLDGGYRVERLEEDRAVLKNGRDVLVIKKA